jgi:hypothetical protein
MNVYFCDVCGVRVTDVDLHSGHGMRRRNDVICGACLELGHGKEWMANHAEKRAPALVGAAANGTNGAHTEAPPAPPVELARDRVRTLDDDVPASKIDPVVVPTHAPSGDGVPEIDDTTKLPVVEQNLSSAVAGLAAMTPPKEDRRSSDEDVEELPPPKLDDSGAAAKLDDSGSSSKLDDSAAVAAIARGDTDGMGPEAAPAEGDEQTEDDPEKSETAISNRIEEVPGRRATSSRSSARGKSSGSRSSKVPKSSRKAARSKGIPPVMIVSGMTLLLVLLIGIGVIRHANDTANKGVEKVTDNISKKIRDAISEADSSIKSAHNAKTMDQLNDALSKIDRVRDLSKDYVRIAGQQGVDEETADTQLEAYGVNRVMSMRRMINEDRAIILGQSH